MPNPGGANQFEPYKQQPAYGEVNKQNQLLRSAPLAGAPVSPLNAPRRAKNRATRGQAQPEAQAVTAPPTAATVNEPFNPSTIWQALSDSPGASELIREYAKRAQS